MRHIIPISGKDSLACALVQMDREPLLSYEFLFCDVKMELPETYRWLQDVEQSLGIEIVRIGKSLEAIIHEQNMLPSQQRRFCTKYGKIFPIKEFIGDDDAIQYVGLRADEVDRMDSIRSDGLPKAFPLIEEGIDLKGVYEMLGRRKLLPPSFFWQRLHDSVLEVAGPATVKWINELEPWNRNHLFAWRSRSNCFMCFYQRMYEWVGLLEHHPDLFARAEKLEWDYGSLEGSNRTLLKQSFNLRPDGPLSFIRDKADRIFNKRVDQVRWAAVAGRHDAGDLMATVSCGIYCGK